MRIAIAGAGAVAYGTAAFLIQNGHVATLWSPSGRRAHELASGTPLTATGVVAGEFAVEVATSAQALVTDADAIIIALPAYGQKAVMDAIAPHISAGQIVIVSSQISLSALYIAKLLARRGVAAPVVAWSAPLVTGRQNGATAVNVTAVKKKIDMAAVPASRNAEALARCETIFGPRFALQDDLLMITLSNLNPQNHMGVSLCNFTRIEKGEVWGQHEHITDSVGRLCEGLDGERLEIARRFGYALKTVRDHYHASYGVPRGPVGEMALARHNQGGAPKGPTNVATRYVTEDVPFGLLTTVLLGRISGAPAAIHDAGITLFSALYGRDFRAENDILAALDLDGMTPAALQALVRDGWQGSAA
jgi:opine dehydrogenase